MTERVVEKVSAASVALSPTMRIVRTVIQAILAFGAAEPTLIGGLGLTGVEATKVAAIVSALVLVASTIQNLLEHFGLISTVGGKAAA